MDFGMKPEKDALDALYEEIRNFKPGRQPEPGGETPTPSPNLSSFMDLTSLPVPEVPSYVPGQHSHNHPAQQSIYPNVVNMAPPLYSGNENQQRLYTGHQNAYHRDLSVTSAPSHRTSLLAHPDRNASTTDASPSLCPSTLALFPQSTPTLSFPTALQPPTVPIRLKPYTPAIAQLEAECARHDEVIPDGERRMGEGRQEARKGEEELRAWDARATLDKHVAARMGFAQLASERLQAVLGEKNDWTFQLPDLPINRAPSVLSNHQHKLNPRLSPIPSNISLSPTSAAKRRSGERRKDSGVALARGPLRPLSPFGFGGQVDELTGKGLREWLLSRGKEMGGQRRRECRNIAFHDFTPNMRTGDHSNVLVACYNGGGLHERVDAYELDLPTTYTDLATGQTAVTPQTWIWFLISRPVLSFSSPPTSSSGDTDPHTPTANATDPKPSYSNPFLRAAPDFPFPIPTSWVVFACPASNVTSYASARDDSAPLPSGPNSASHRSFAARTTVHKRKDYDFSHQGTPLFEFGCATLFPAPRCPRTAFLSVDGMPGWEEDDAYGFCTEREGEASMGERASAASDDEEGEGEGEGGSDSPSVRKGKWWSAFYKGMYADEARWERIREAMSRGKCRVVVRWVERDLFAAPREPGLAEAMMGLEEDGDAAVLSHAGVVGLGVTLDAAASGSGGGRKIKERLAGRKTSSRNLLRRSALALGAEALGSNGHVMGVGREDGDDASHLEHRSSMDVDGGAKEKKRKGGRRG